MHRAPHLIAVFAVVLFGLVTAGRSLASYAPEATPTARGDGIAGSWRMTVREAQAPPFAALGTFGADGTAVISFPPTVAPPRGSTVVAHTSAGHGAWVATGPDTMVLTYVLMATDGAGNPYATRTDNASITVGADGQTFHGEFVTMLANPAGTVAKTESGTIQATRIVAEGPETPGAMPLAGTPAA